MLLFFLFGCQPAPQATSQCTENGIVESKRLDENTSGYGLPYLVYLPPCFDPKTADGYPILYMIPGRGSSPQAWMTNEFTSMVDQFIRDENIPPFLVVVTYTTDNDGDGSFIVNDLIPTVSKQYPIRIEREHHAIAGASLGGISAYRIALSHPDQFSSVGMFGSGIISGEEKRVEAWMQAIPKSQAIRFFLFSGEQDPLMVKQAKVMQTILNKYQVENLLIRGDGGHDYPSWLKYFPSYLQWLAEKWN